MKTIVDARSSGTDGIRNDKIFRGVPSPQFAAQVSVCTALVLLLTVLAFIGSALGQSAQRREGSSSGLRTLPRVTQAPTRKGGPSKSAESPTPKSSTDEPDISRKTLELSLAESIRIGLARNFDIQIEQLNPRIRTQDIQREEAAFDVVGFAEGSVGETFDPSNSALAQVSRGETSVQSVRGGIRRRFNTGTLAEVSTGVQRSTNNAGFIQFDPAVEPTASISLTQNLLRNFGIGANTTAIRVARNNEKISVSAFRNRIIEVISNIENFYWELIFSIQDLAVKNNSLALAKDLLRRNQIQVDVGTLAPIEIVQAQASVAAREADLITAERQVKDNEDRLKRALNLPTDITSWDLGILPKDKPEVIQALPDVQGGFKTAIQNRPDYAQAKLDLENKNIQVKFAENQLFPLLDLRGTFALNGLDSSLRSAIGDTTSGDFYEWVVALTFEYPLRNRAAKSTLTQRKLEAAQSILSLRNLEEQIFLEVREAVRAIVTARNRVKATSAARGLAEQQLEAEEKKFAVGLSTNFEVLRLQDDLATAQSNETRAITDHVEALVTFRRVTGQTLTRHRIRLEDVRTTPQ